MTVQKALRLVPLGGLGEVGMNCLVLEHPEQRLIIDCGVTFADGELGTLGADVIRPDFAHLLEAPDCPTAIVLTHGHEDHIGAVPFLLQELGPLPVCGPAHALALVSQRLQEFPRARASELFETPPGRRYALGPFSIEPVRVTHSIVEATSLSIDTPVGRIIHTGDFKIDPSPEAPYLFDAERFRQLGDEGVRLLLSDSTNADVERPSGAETDVAQALLGHVQSAPQRVVVALFASNTHRIRAVLAAARGTGRRVCLVGRSMRNHLRIAGDLGHLENADDLLVTPQQAAVLPRNQVLIAATGTQAEAAAGLSRLARGTHPQLELGAGDRVVLSSRVIPGHELGVWALMDSLRRKGVEVIDARRDPAIHVSGHAYRDDQRKMLELTRPEYFIPVHGTYSHLTAHAALAQQHSRARTMVIENGDRVEMDAEGLRWLDQVPTGRVHLGRGNELHERVLHDRARLARSGIAMASITLCDDQLAAPVELLTRGVLLEDEHGELLQDARDALTHALTRSLSRGARTDDDLCAEARRTLGRFFQRNVGVKVPAYVLVTRMDPA